MQINKFLKDGHLPEGTQLWEESQTIEYKKYQYPFTLERLNQIYALYSAWLNTTGGALFLGVIDKSCSVEGIDLKKTELAISKELLSIERANITPTPPTDCFRLTFIPVKSTVSKERYVIRIEIKHGDKMTYYGRDTGYFNYIRMNQWNEKENKFEKVKLKINHVQRLDEDMNNLNNQPKFEFDNSYEFPNISIEKPSEEVLKKTQEIQRKNMAAKLKSALGKRTTQGTFGYLDNLLGSVENPNIYHIQNVWSGLKGIEELQDSVIRKLEKIISTSQVEEVKEDPQKPTPTSEQNQAPKVTESISSLSKVEVEETKISKAPENSLTWEKIEKLVVGTTPNNIPSQQSTPAVAEIKNDTAAPILEASSKLPPQKKNNKKHFKKEYSQIVKVIEETKSNFSVPVEQVNNNHSFSQILNNNNSPNQKKKNKKYPKKEILQTIFVAKSTSNQ